MARLHSIGFSVLAIAVTLLTLVTILSVVIAWLGSPYALQCINGEVTCG